MQDLAKIRKDYSLNSLDEASVARNPFKQFETWFNEAMAAQVPEPTAMTLATVSANNRPSARIVLLKGFSDQGFTFFTNYQSNKGKDLIENPYCSLSFFWPELERQVRIEGLSERVTGQESDAYFNSRPRESQLGAWTSPQSSVIASRKILEERFKALEMEYAGQPTIKRPSQWGGYLVKPFQVEFWQGRVSRLHDRIVYTKEVADWKRARLAP
jgi:pyridoxamine 5'-phosphate oxidase